MCLLLIAMLNCNMTCKQLRDKNLMIPNVCAAHKLIYAEEFSMYFPEAAAAWQSGRRDKWQWMQLVWVGMGWVG